MGLFSSSENTYLGIDIGDSSLKMVELAKKGKKIVLNNYGFSEDLGGPNKLTSTDDIEYVAKLINKVKKDIGIATASASVSLPSFSVFSSVINLYNVNKKNIAEHVNEEAKKVIPLPLEEMVLDWKVIPQENADPNNPSSNTKIFLTGSPKKLIKKYISIFSEAKINLVSLETETFSLIRSLLGNDKSTVMIVDLGANSTDICVVKESIPYLNRSINVSGNTITEAISQKLGISMEKASQLKFDLGVAALGENQVAVPQIIMSAVNPIINEIKYMIELFENSNNEKVEKIILSGGGSMLINLSNYLENTLNIQVIIGNPWFRTSYPKELQPVLSEVGPRLSIAIGLAMRSIE
ncbi:MAG: type IV pilus assembly protein PilM [Candidatus Falkowbacteria bacterium]